MGRAKKAVPVRFPEFQTAFNELMGDMTIEKFAEKIGMSRATVGFYSAGQRIPDALGVKTIAEKCGVSADWLLGLSGYRTITQKQEANDLFNNLTALMEIEFDERDRIRVRRTLIKIIEGFKSAIMHYYAYTWYENAIGRTALALSTVAQCIEFALQQEGISYGDATDEKGQELFVKFDKIIKDAAVSAYTDLGYFFNACRQELQEILNAGDCYSNSFMYISELEKIKAEYQE